MLTHAEDTAFDPPLDTYRLDSEFGPFEGLLTGARDAKLADVDLTLYRKGSQPIVVSLAEAIRLRQIIDCAFDVWRFRGTSPEETR